MSALFDTVREGVGWRLRRAHTRTVDLFSDIWKRVEWRSKRLAWDVYSHSVYRLAFLYRPLLRRTAFIGITGSAAKTTTKDLLAAILARHFTKGQKGRGTLNGPYDVGCLVLRTRPSDAYSVIEIAITNEAGIDFPLALFRPTVGVVTNIGGDHVAAYGSLDGVAAEKSKLIKSLPASGVAVLNADDPRVLAMRSQFSGRAITYGMSPDAMLQGSGVSASWPDRLSFTVKWNGQSAWVQTQLCGSHWAPAVLAALASGVALGVPLRVAAEAVSNVAPFEARMSPVQLADGVTFIRDNWKSPFWSIAIAFDFMRQARATRKIIVMGTISDYSGPSTPRYLKIAREALAVADCVLFVGPPASACLRAKRSANDQLFAFPSLNNAADYLAGYLRQGDLVLLKGAVRTDHLERLILSRTGNVECWRLACRRMYFCNVCTLLHVKSNAEGMPTTASAVLGPPEPDTIEAGSPVTDPPGVVIVGLGNPGEQRMRTPHNIGQCALDILAERLTATWTREGDMAVIARTIWQGQSICLMKLPTLINDTGPTLLPLSQKMGFSVKDCIVVQDDLDLPIGTVRSRQRGGDGGHRGVRSIIQAFQDDKFRRVKIGVGKPAAGQSVDDYVLTPFPPEQTAAIDTANQTAADRVMEMIKEGFGSKLS